jgi:hypothetical protein
LTVVEIKGIGVHPDKFISLFHNFPDIVPKYNKEVSFKRLDTDGGYLVVH